ncbi:MAG: ATP-binding protein [Planctomycetales bacterium]|nr:ATP-binding protein [Planctomycetales bacterium]
MDAAVEIALPASLDGRSAAPCVLGPENESLAPPLRQLLSETPLPLAAERFNPLVLTGPAGTGKTMVARAAVRRFTACYGADRVWYFTGADFAREYQCASEESRLVETLHRWSNAALLVIDGLDQLRPRHPAQWELRRLVDAIVHGGGCLVATARQPLACLPQLERGLCDRLACGLSLGLKWPGEAARRTLLADGAARRGLPLPDKQLHQLAHKHEGPPAQVVAALAKIELRSAGPAIPGADDDDPAAGPTFKQIASVVGRYFSITQTALTSPSRRKSLVYARCVAIYLARQLTDMSYAEIGQGLGGRDHTTIIHGEHRIAEQLGQDPATQETIDQLIRILKPA